MDAATSAIIISLSGLIVSAITAIGLWRRGKSQNVKDESDAAKSMSEAATVLLEPYQKEVARLLIEIETVKKVSAEQITRLTALVLDLQKKEVERSSQLFAMKKENAWLTSVLHTHGIDIPPMPEEFTG